MALNVEGCSCHVQEGGIQSLFRGAGPRMVVQAPLFGIALLAFEALKTYYASLE